MKKLFLISLLIGNVAWAETSSVFKCNCPTKIIVEYQQIACNKISLLYFTQANANVTKIVITPENNPSKPIGCELIK